MSVRCDISVSMLCLELGHVTLYRSQNSMQTLNKKLLYLQASQMTIVLGVPFQEILKVFIYKEVI